MKTLLLLSLLVALTAQSQFATPNDLAFWGNRPVPPCADITTGLMAYWSFDSGTTSGATATDLGPYGNTATVVAGGSTNFVSGHLGNCLELTRANSQYATIPNSVSLHDYITNGFTISLWFKLKVLPGANQYPELFGKNTDVHGYGVYVDNNDAKVYPQIGTTATWVATPSSSAVVTNTWYHVALVNRTNYVFLFLNGVSQGTPYSWGQFSDVTYGSTGAAEMGNHFYWSASFMDGYLDEVRIYNRGLADCDVAALAAQ